MSDPASTTAPNRRRFRFGLRTVFVAVTMLAIIVAYCSHFFIAARRDSDLALSMLCLHNTKLTDLGLMRLKALKRIKRLILSGTELTDEGLATFADLGELEVLTIVRTACTIEGVEAFRKAHPNVVVAADDSLETRKH